MPHTQGPWYYKEATYQGLVISELSGATIAVTYDKQDTTLIASAPSLLQALTELRKHSQYVLEKIGLPHDDAMMMLALIDQANEAINKAEGRS